MWTGTALAVALPDTVEQVAALVRWCAVNCVHVIPQGGNTGMSGGATPPEDGVNLVIALTRLNRIRAIDPVNNTMSVDAGVALAKVQEVALEAGRFFPLSLAAEGSCTIGGNLATNAGGTAVLRYGNARELCLGLEVVTPIGEIWDGLRGLRKDNSGYDLRDLFIASEGTLGIITGAVLKLFPKPAARLAALVCVESCDAAMALLGSLRARHADRLTAFELASRDCLELVFRHAGARDPFGASYPWYVLVEFTDFVSEDDARQAIEVALGEAFEAGLIVDAVIAESLAQSQALWSLREGISEAQSAEGATIKHDIAVPLSAIAAFVPAAIAAVAARHPDIRPVVFGHLGDGSLHFNYSPAIGETKAAFLQRQKDVNDIVHDLTIKAGGTISAEHGLGVLRRDEADAYRKDPERRMMLAIKQALDPQGIMNPGKLLVR
ncbi:MAG: FAD-binding oxidoreductase [Novosphingobium sp.]